MTRGFSTRWRAALRTVPIGLVLLAIAEVAGSLSLAVGQPPLQSAVPAPNLEKVRIDQRLDAQIPLDLTFTDDTGQSVRLGQYFTDKPVILVLAYYRCPMLCTLVLNDLTETMIKMPLTLEKDYRVVTVSFDPQETPTLAAEKRKHYLEHYGRAGTGEGWHFLTGDAEAIAKLAEAVGFHYVYDDQQKQFLHPSGITVLTPSGKISRYFFGIDYSPRDLRLALVEASSGNIGTPTDQILLYCFHYDPKAGKYTPSVLNFVRVGGVVVVVGLGVFVWFLKRGERHRRRASPSPPLPTPSQGEPP